MADLLSAVEIETAPAPTASIIWLHGLGADGNDFVPLVPELHLEQPTRFTFPHAPARPVTINGDYVMRAWFDITPADRQEDALRGSDKAGIAASQAQIEALIAREKARGIATDKIVLAGFSQGGVIALQTALRHTERLAGVLALSTFLANGDTLPQEATVANAGIPIFLAHGHEDTVIPMSLAAHAREVLTQLHYNVTWHVYAMSHSVCAEEIYDINIWLKHVLA